MQMLNQRDEKWGNLNLGFSKSKIKDSGCFLTCLSMLSDTTPDKANDILKQALAFSKDLIISDKAAKALDLEYNPPARSESFPVSHICIAEVDFSPSPGKQQHFVVFDPFKRIFIDPYYGGEVPMTTYQIVSLRLFKAKEMDIYKKTISSTAPLLNFEFGENLNENESEKYIAKIDDLIEKNSYLSEKNDKLDSANQELAEMCATQQETIDELEKEKSGKVLFNKYGILIIKK